MVASEAFPESEKRAIKAVKEARKGLTKPLEPIMTTMEDYIVAMAARVSHMKVLGIDFPLAAIQAFKALYPGEAKPTSIKDLCDWLRATNVQLDDWRASAGRAGADTALKFATSWYKTLDLDALATLRSSSFVLSDEALIKKRQSIAYEIARYAPVHEFIQDPNDPEPLEEEGGPHDDEASGEDDAEDGSGDEDVDEELLLEETPVKNSAPTDPSTSSTASTPETGTT
jgi:hypothetical protein